MNKEYLNNQKLIIEDTNESVDFWINQPFIPDSLKETLKKASVLILPRLDTSQPCFTSETEKIWIYFKENAEPGLTLDICTGEENFACFALHGIIINLGSFILTCVLAPLFVNKIQSYLDTSKKELISKDAEIRFELTIINSDSSNKKIKYQGPADKFKDVIKLTEEMINHNGKNRNISK